MRLDKTTPPRNHRRNFSILFGERCCRLLESSMVAEPSLRQMESCSSINSNALVLPPPTRKPHATATFAHLLRLGLGISTYREVQSITLEIAIPHVVHFWIFFSRPCKHHAGGDVHILRARDYDDASESILAALRSSSFTCLKTLRLEYCYFTGEPSRIVFPILTSLTLFACGMPLLKTLSTPLLSHFELHFALTTSDSSGLVSFIQKSASTLTRLSLSDSLLSDRDLISLFKKLHTLIELQVSDKTSPIPPVFSDALFNGLHSQTNEPCVLPQLQTLSISGDLPLSADSLLLDVLESRCDASATCRPLRAVQLHPKTSFEPETNRRLEALAERGMDVTAVPLY
ncbi:hypothetical protein C8F04DRAFT_1228422 [Mycena alexandri]|uniref:Uncharacterized protein n=1 Tax=Mycena alexandri TaxID=1745969 RepID=A0AAD6XE45_9AGAR|nr:hypothetical protein C8F04DRAFT_1228422 [Mycena alexandri]